jgi:8-oxo-dGTP pyrophosphatase MutT (NUDIX family)
VQHPDGRFLAVHESRGRGWWLPAGFVDPGDDLMSAAIRETKEEAGVDVRLEGTALARALTLRRPHIIVGVVLSTGEGSTFYLSPSLAPCLVFAGILRIEHTMTLYRGRCRIVFFARPIDPSQPPKSEPDKESEGAGTPPTHRSVSHL